jgi:hypothetical protein
VRSITAHDCDNPLHNCYQCHCGNYLDKRHQSQGRGYQKILLSQGECCREISGQFEDYRNHYQQLVKKAREDLFIFEHKNGSLVEAYFEAEDLFGFTMEEGNQKTCMSSSPRDIAGEFFA